MLSEDAFRGPVSSTPDRVPVSTSSRTLPLVRPHSKLTLSSLTPLPLPRGSASVGTSQGNHCGDDSQADPINRKLSFQKPDSKPSAASVSASADAAVAAVRVKPKKANQLRALPELALDRLDVPSEASSIRAACDKWSGDGGFARIANGIDVDNPKFQVAMNARRTKVSGRAKSPTKVTSKVLDNIDWYGVARVADNEYYFDQRAARPVYRNQEVHCMVLELALQLMLAADGPLLDPQHTQQFPLEKHRPNLPHLLRHHMNHAANEHILPELLSRVSARGASAHRLLKLLVNKLFQPSRYCNRDANVRFRGAFGTVYRVMMPSEPFELAVKVMELPKDLHSPCTLQDLFTEVSIMAHLRREAGTCHMYDFGVDKEHCYIVTAWYRMSLKHWRTHQPQDLLQQPSALAFLMAVGAKVLRALCCLTDERVVHYDIKCDNVLLVADRDVSDADLLSSVGRQGPVFDVVITDFGESKMYSPTQDGYTTRNRGTEYIKSPEMLTVANASSKERANYDRRKKAGVDKASDAWSATCLLYEILTGDYLFFDDDWIRFFIRVTGGAGEQMIAPERLAPLLQLPGGDQLVEFFHQSLVRDPLRRPTLHDLAARWDSVAASVAGGTCTVSRATAVSARGWGGTGQHVQQQLSAKRVERDPMRASALLLHEVANVSEVDCLLQGVAAVSLGWNASCHAVSAECTCQTAPSYFVYFVHFVSMYL